MSLAKKKRFWREVKVVGSTGGFVIHLDGRVVKTPAKHDLNVPTRAAAELIAAEWDAVDKELDPTQMPATLWGNVAIDRVGEKHAEVMDNLAAYGGTDLLCYRATHPESLVARQAEVWDRPLAWAAKRFDAPLTVTQGIIPVEQPNQSVQNLRAEVAQMEPFALSAFHDLVHISGSLVLSLAIYHGEMSAESVWETSRVDEIWQNELWGEDEDAEEAAAKKCASFVFAAKLLESVSVPT